jgi:hypothetical protein
VIDDRDRDLGTVMSYLVGRPVRTVELAKALGVARSSYYAARDEQVEVRTREFEAAR